jgi:hypothetical protein
MAWRNPTVSCTGIRTGSNEPGDLRTDGGRLRGCNRFSGLLFVPLQSVPLYDQLQFFGEASLAVMFFLPSDISGHLKRFLRVLRIPSTPLKRGVNEIFPASGFFCQSRRILSRARGFDGNPNRIAGLAAI